MNNLLNQRVYLGGPIDFCKNKGKSWRKEITPILHQYGLKVLDPTNKPTPIAREESSEYFALKAKLRLEEKYDELAEIMKPIRNIDLRMCDISDFLIVYLDISIQSCGTWEELFISNKQKKPILVVCPQGKQHLSDWLFATIPHKCFFDNFDQLFEYLNYIDITSEDKIDTMGRWKFFKGI